MEEFFLKLAALLEEFYFLGLILVLAFATNAAANLLRAIQSGRDAPKATPPQQRDLPLPTGDEEMIQTRLERTENLLAEQHKPV